MSITPGIDISISQTGVADIPVSPGAMHGPLHGMLDGCEIAGHDEVDHETALRDSALRVPR